MLDYVKVEGPDAFVDLSTLTRDQAAAIQEVTVEDYKDGGENARDVRRVKVKLSDKRAAGPGIWTRRIADYANHIGLAATVVCFDISTTQLEIARKETERYLVGSKGPKSTLEFQERDLSKPLPWAAGSFQLVLCNYAVLNHLCGARSHRRTLPRFDRSRDRNLRTLGSAASACIIGMEHVSTGTIRRAVILR